MKSKLIRKTFLSFFKEKKHRIISSFPIYSKNDPTLLFVNAGMNPFKDYFLGYVKPKYSRIVNIQKCLRVTGKHNDLENVGYDNYHHTMFEMLGNWSFGDYSRKEIIEWTWELLVKVYKIPKKNIYVSIFIGDKKDSLSMDKESFKYWKNLMDENHILFFGKKENFWEMGATGPCGPCTEIHIDLRNEKDKKILSGKYLINKNHPNVIEIWNLVFIEFFRKFDGTLEILPIKHVDTGMGLERLTMVLQEKFSSYETDLFYSIIQDIKSYFGNINEKDIHQNISIKIIADHLRALVFSISDGQLPSNNGAGYVIRKILRRAVIYANRFFSQTIPFIYQLVDSLIIVMKDIFPDLEKNKQYIQNIIQEEEISFFRVIEKGSQKIKHIITKTKKKNENIIDGKIIFQLYDTYGFPIELSKMLVEKNNLLIDNKLFQKKLSEQKERSRKKMDSIVKTDWIKVHDHQFYENNFVGYNVMECNDVLILKYRKVENKLDKTHYYELVFSKTPFYPEGGGQLGDTGHIRNNFDDIFIFNTKKENSVIIHSVRKLPSSVFHSFKAIINENRRKEIEKNHTSTHLLYFALKQILGNHIQQKGSYIGDDYLRFDFSHYKKITTEELHNIDNLVQELIFSDIYLEEKRYSSLEEARKVSSFFHSETFEDNKQVVRVITFDKSSELCIGTHVKHTGLIHVFKIISESSISYGIRRIKAITSKKAILYLKSIENQYLSIKKAMNNPESPIKSFFLLQNSNKKLKQEISKIYSYKIKTFKKKYFLKSIQLTSSIKYICDIDSSQEIELDINIIKKIVLDLRNEISDLFLITGFKKSGKAVIFISISNSVINNKNIHANEIIRPMASYICGKYWGKSFFSTAIGSNIDGLNLVLKDIINIKNRLMKNNLIDF
ncbi:alanine--tRNA ligase [Blattabacterium cuenoti]|uniref:alanine--tRNA ligase n=1 Tax=Blattabacterium cuenoti TaxID=1653831 RepID=UPI00163BD82E|nr:alanine--tRNA ligase [Blattabacterium cuenoti]